MPEVRPTAYIFGAGSGGTKAFRFFRRDYRILGFCDNDVTRHGKTFHGLPIVAPARLTTVDCDRVIIGSQFFQEIADQLIVAGLAPGKIIVADSEVLEGLYCFSSGLVACLAGAFAVVVLALYGLIELFAS